MDQHLYPTRMKETANEVRHGSTRHVAHFSSQLVASSDELFIKNRYLLDRPAI